MNDYRDRGHSVEDCEAGLVTARRRPDGEVRRWWLAYWEEQRIYAVTRAEVEEAVGDGD